MPKKQTITISAVLFVIPFVCAATTSAETITIRAGDKGKPAGPAFCKLKQSFPADQTVFQLQDGPRVVFAQMDDRKRLWWWQGSTEPDQTLTYSVSPISASEIDQLNKVELKKVADGLINISIEGKLFTAFHFKAEQAKPYLYPLIGPTGDPVTRDYPMVDNELEKINKCQDHHHHTSVWCTHGDVRTGDFTQAGSNYWYEPEDASLQDRQKVKRIVRMVSGPVFGQLEAEIEWIAKDGRRELTEYRTYTFFRSAQQARIIDVRNVFKFTDCDVMFADTKEGGIIALRLAATMTEKGVTKPKRRHGQMTNSNGQVGMKECWGQAADWCDYVGPVNSQTVGVAVFDHPSNFRHPTCWHIRDYGLFTANPFGLSYFTQDQSRDGSQIWKKGETARFNYRILIHQGDTKAARIADCYRSYSEQEAD